MRMSPVEIAAATHALFVRKVARDCLDSPQSAMEAQKKPLKWPFRGFRGLEGLEGFRPGKRQAWTPIRSHGCGRWKPIRSH